MKRRFRIVSATVVALTALAIAGLYVPAATAAPDKSLVFVTQPHDSEKSPATIRSADLNQASAFVQVKLVDASGNLITNSNSSVTFSLLAGPGLVTNNSLSVTAQPLINGVATFGEGTLSIGTPNEPQFSSYRLVPSTTGGGPKITGAPSDDFDIFQNGESCALTDTCDATIRDTRDDYSVANVAVGTTLGASQLSDSTLSTFGCAGQKEIFADSVFVHVTTEADTNNVFAPVKLVSHITRQEMKKATNNGQAHVQWCVGLKTAAAWQASGGTFIEQDTNGSAPGGTLFVGFAPACPQSNPQNFAPCIVSQNGDGNGGNVTTGWLPGGDPPRKT